MLVFLKVKNDQFDKIIFSCVVNIMRFDDIDIIIYLVFVINYMVLIYENFFFDVIKDNNRVELSDYFNIVGKQILLVIMKIVSFNNVIMRNEYVVLNLLIFRIYSY